MVNINGKILSDNEASLSINNRGYSYGDSIFETLKVTQDKILFFEDHYFRLMASMRILRMEIPMNFTPEFLESEVFRTISANSYKSSSERVKVIVNRKEGGLYEPESNEVEYLIITSDLKEEFYEFIDDQYVVELYKDNYVSPTLLSTLKSNNRLINVVGSVFAKENGYQNCLLLNTNKHVIEALNGNLFLITDNKIKTPPIEDGCINGVIRKQLINIITQIPEFELEEISISPFELQKADELFITNIIIGIQPVSQYRKRRFRTEISRSLLAKLNMTIRS